MAKRREAPAPESNNDMNPFLKAKDIDAKGDELKISGWVNERPGKFGPQIVMEVLQERTGKTFDFGIGVGSPNHRRLFKLFGGEYAKWAGKAIHVEVQNNKGVTFIAITGDAIPF
jgi:hypothetical protein